MADAFWRAVGTNLKEGRIRLVFVADEIPASLQRLVEFLNEQMPRVEVLALEIRQHRAAGGSGGGPSPPADRSDRACPSRQGTCRADRASPDAMDDQ